MLTEHNVFQKAKNDLTDPLKTGIEFSPEAMRLMIDSENQARMKKGEPLLNCYVIDSNKKTEFHEFINMLQTIANSQEEPIRVQLLSVDRLHYTAVDFEINKKTGNTAILYDAAGDMRATLLHFNIDNQKTFNGQNKLFSKVFMPSNESVRDNQQKDYFSCPAFSFDHICQSSRLPNIHQEVMKLASENNTVRWHQLPPQFIWNAQSYGYLDKYKENYPENFNKEIPGLNINMQQYLEAGKSEVDGKKINSSITVAFNKYQQQASSYLNENTNKLTTLKTSYEQFLNDLPKDKRKMIDSSLDTSNRKPEPLKEKLQELNKKITIYESHLASIYTNPSTSQSIRESYKMRNEINLCINEARNLSKMSGDKSLNLFGKQIQISQSHTAKALDDLKAAINMEKGLAIQEKFSKQTLKH